MNLSQKKNQNPLITTILPTFRRPENLQKAIQSVLNQSFPDFQVCVYDNHSQDTTAEIVEKLQKQDPRVKYFCHAQNIGAIANFQYGLERVSTPFFSFLSDDDVLLPGFFEITIKGFQKYSAAMFSCGEVIVVDETGRVRLKEMDGWDQEFFNPPNGLYALIARHLNWTGILFRSEIIPKIGNLDPNIPIIDVDYILRTAATFPYVITKKPCALFITHPKSYSRNAGLKLFWPGYFKIRDKLVQFYDENIAIKEKIDELIKKRFIDFVFPIFNLAIKEKNFKEANEIIEIVQEFNEKSMKTFLMRKCFFLMKYLPFLHSLFLLVLNFRRSQWIKMKNLLLFNKEKELKKFVKLYLREKL